MNIKSKMIVAAALLALVGQPSYGAKAIGFNRTAIPANTDVRVTIPFNTAILENLEVASVTETEINITSSIEANKYSGNAYYVRVVSGEGEGLWATITSNSAGVITVSDNKILPYIKAGDKLRVYKHYTLGTVFPKTLLNVAFTKSTRILLFKNNTDAMAENKPAVKTAFYVSGKWLGAGVNNNTIIEPETQFIIRNNDAVNLTLITHGTVPDYKVSAIVAPGGDLNIGSGYPVPVKIKDAGLSGALRKILLFDNNASGQNKPASKTAFSVNGNWLGAGITGNETIDASASFTLRLPAAESAKKVTFKKPY